MIDSTPKHTGFLTVLHVAATRTVLKHISADPCVQYVVYGKATSNEDNNGVVVGEADNALDSKGYQTTNAEGGE